MSETSRMTAPIQPKCNSANIIHRYKVEKASSLDIVLYIYISSKVQQAVLQKDKGTVPIIRFSEFLGIGYFGDKKQRVIAPIFDLRHNAERGWEKVMTKEKQAVPIFHVIFVEHSSKYEFTAHPIEMAHESINYVLYRSFSSLSSLNKF
jgi:hypothetical protein